MDTESGLLIANAALVVITGVYAALTYRLAQSSQRSAEAGERAADAASEAASASRESLRLQRAALSVSSNTHEISFSMHPAGPFAGGFGFALRTDGNSYFIREVVLENLTFAVDGDADPGFTFGLGTPVEPERVTLPCQLDGPDHLLFEVGANSLAESKFPGRDWSIKWWDCIVSCSLSEDDPTVRRVVVRAPSSPQAPEQGGAR